ncbi:hypothetical protein [Sphingobacterium pedocola]|uniref:Uncharacterized protein n=1 Tax=Sphingobacterium pedocola TaxID=2082722 RepID=A0ABR9T5K2_9SPHI|nr:hypothetical protein [Sphingobacterium pedocola]MBE8719947.1 hypothetical protein [Sphingobacterium pedocola]
MLHLFKNMFGTKPQYVPVVANPLPVLPRSQTLDLRLDHYLYAHRQFPTHIKKQLGNTGFLVTALGTQGFLPFNRMPWQYPVEGCWTVVAPQLIGKRIFCTLSMRYEEEKNPYRPRFMADANVHGFPRIKLVRGEQYQAILLRRSRAHVLLELGGHFDWQYGSIVAVQHRSAFEDPYTFEHCKKGHSLLVTYRKYFKNNISMCGDIDIPTPWYDCTKHEGIGEVLDFEVSKHPDGGRPRLLVDGYMATIRVHKEQFGENKEIMIQALKKLESGSTLRAEIVKYRPDLQKISVRLTDEQAQELLEKEQRDLSLVCRALEDVAHSPDMTRYTIFKSGGEVNILEKEVRAVGLLPVIEPGINLRFGPYTPTFHIWTYKTTAEEIALDFLRYQPTDTLHTIIGNLEVKNTRQIEWTYTLLRQQGFMDILAEKVAEHFPDITVSEGDGYRVVKNKRINILFTQGLTLNFKTVRWWELPNYATQRFILVKIPEVSARRVQIFIDHHKVTVGDGVYFIDPIVDACWSVLQGVIGADALANDGERGVGFIPI